MKKNLIILSVIIVALFTGGYLYFKNIVPPTVSNTHNASSSQNNAIVSDRACLQDNEYADYPLDPQYASSTLSPKLPLVISVRDKSSKQEKFKFQVEDLPLGQYHPIEIHNCNVYVIKGFDYNAKKGTFGPNYRMELWKHSYNGVGEKILTFSNYSYDFRIDPNEKYLVLEQSYLGKPDYALVIKDLKTMNDLFVWKLTDLVKQYSSAAVGNFGLGWWIDDGKHLLGDIYDGALDVAYYQIEAGTWKIDFYLSPPELLAGVERGMNYDKGYLAYVDIPTFTGFQEVADQLVDQALKEGRQKNLFLYNFATKQTIKVASIDPRKRFDLKWVSSSTLEYASSSGATSTYTILQ